MIALPSQLQKPSEDCLTFWVIYAGHSDCPDGYMLRAQWACSNKIYVSKDAWYAKTLDELHSILPPWLNRMGPFQGDDPTIIEVWME